MRYDWTLLRAGRLLLDGGGMFGLIPRVVWQRTVQPDDQHRIELQHNCVLLRAEDGSATYLIETGTGDKLDDKMASIFGLDGRTVESAVRDAGTDPSAIDAVFVSHLHFDHAGGLTRRCRDGESPDDARHDVKLTFPNARVITQQVEWDDAIANNSVMTRTYYRDHLDPIDRRLRQPDALHVAIAVGDGGGGFGAVHQNAPGAHGLAGRVLRIEF